MDEDRGHVFLIIQQGGGRPGVAVKQVVLRNGDPEVNVLDNGRINLFLLQKPVAGCLAPDLDCVLILQAPLPAAERARIVAVVRDIHVLKSIHKTSSSYVS